MAESKELSVIEQVLVMGDLGRLTTDQRVVYYNKLCESLGLNPLTRPFDYISLNGRLQLYAKKDATEQLRKLYGISIKLEKVEIGDGIVAFRAHASDPKGRSDESIGAVNIATLRGEALANAVMKAETKAKRRVTLSICGLGMLDETEVDSIPGASANVVPMEALPPPPKPVVPTVELEQVVHLHIPECSPAQEGYIISCGGYWDEFSGLFVLPKGTKIDAKAFPKLIKFSVPTEVQQSLVTDTSPYSDVMLGVEIEEEDKKETKKKDKK
jgi:hypothetical protein